MDESCKHTCICTDESYHESCVTSSTSTGKPDVTSLTPKITTTSAKCIFNPCSVENFCGDGRKCELDKTCKHKCVCLDSFTHENCRAVTVSSDSSTTQSVICAFNPCSTRNFNFCGEGRRCLFDKKTCKHSCECLDDFTHDNCKPEAPTTTEPSDDEDTGRNCPPGFPCKHGYCQQPPGYKCICDDGWSGVFCDRDESAKCTRKCEEGTKCVILPNYTEVCVKSQPDLTTTGSYDADSSNVCSRFYKLRNESERTCKFGMRCFYGVCNDLEGGGSRCECDPGASGTLCLDKCCRDCGENGDCFLVGGEEKCNCHYNYTGPECKSLKPTGRLLCKS